MSSIFEPDCDKCGAEKARCRSALNGAPLCTSCKEKQDELRREFNSRMDHETAMAMLRDGLNPYA